MKKSSYQKLKDRNQELVNDIAKMIKGTWMEQMETKHRWKMIFDTEDIIFTGRTHNYGQST